MNVIALGGGSALAFGAGKERAVMDSHHSNLWQASCREDFRSAALEGAAEADLVVIGGGYTGLSAALTAAEGGARVVLLEGERIGHGGSGRNVGLCNAGLWLPPEEITKRLGKQQGGRLSQSLGAAPDMVYGLIEKHGIDCEPVRKGTLHCAHSAAGKRDLEDRHRQLRAIGAPVELLDATAARARVGSGRVKGGLFDPRAGTIQPLAFAKGLARAAVAAGARVFEQTPALSVGWENGKWEVATPEGTVFAKSLIQATNAYGRRDSWVHSPRMVAVSYFQAATVPLSEAQRGGILPGGEGCWDTAQVMSSWRLDQAGRLVIGGMGQLDHLASRAHANWVRRKMVRMFPALRGVAFDYLWHGRIGLSQIYLPQILRIGPGGLSCFGFSGRGIGPGTVFGQAMAQAILADSEQPLPVTPVDRQDFPWRRSKTVFYEAGATLTHLVKDRV